MSGDGAWQSSQDRACNPSVAALRSTEVSCRTWWLIVKAMLCVPSHSSEDKSLLSEREALQALPLRNGQEDFFQSP